MLNLPAYTAHEALVAPARPKSQLWRLFMGLVLVAGVFLFANQVMHQTLRTLLGPTAYGALVGSDSASSQISVIFLLSSFGLLIVGIVVALRVVHARWITDVIGDRAVFAKQFAAVLTLLLVMNFAIAILPPWDFGAPLEPNVPFRAWLLVLPFALCAVLIQVSAEEILFRGYLQQQLAARFSSPAVWILVPALLFGWGHYMPQAAGANANLIVIWACIFGVLMADLTARAGTLGPAIAVHFMNNVVAILVISAQESLSGLSLYLSPFTLSDTEQVRAWLPVDFAMMIVSWLAARLAIRR
ncbi:MAG: CPBP family intramembrane glutamic endopeptidase [Pseudomonadota bacterium]